MVSEWRTMPLGELVEIYDGPHATPRKTETGPVFLGISNLAQGRLDPSNTEHLSEEDFARWTRRVTPQAGDVVFSYETRLGEAALIPPGLRCCLGRRMGLLRARPERIDSRFLLYAYLGPEFQATLRSHTIPGSTVDRIPLIDMPTFPIRVPDSIQEQRAIAHVLGTLDEKIELNRRMNETLEAMTRAIFNSWFVNLDPVRAKAAGRDQSRPKPIADFFPDRFEGSERGEIPAGWKIGTLGDLSNKPQYGYTASARSEAIGPRFLRIADINKHAWINWASVPFCEISAENYEKYKLQTGDILVARMADPGHGVMIEEEVDAVFASYLIRFKLKDAEYDRYIQYWLRSSAYWELVISRSAGTTRANLNARELSLFPLIIPSRAVISIFRKVADTLRSRVVANV